MESTHERQLASADFAFVVVEYRLPPWRTADALNGPTLERCVDGDRLSIPRPQECDVTANPTKGAHCTATAKSTGERCRRSPIAGGIVCRVHGGAAPRVKAAAARRLA
jgi:hypothetical protein